MTGGEGLYSASDQAIALFLMDCRVKPGNDEDGINRWDKHAT
jgi:hypothetical protein